MSLNLIIKGQYSISTRGSDYKILRNVKGKTWGGLKEGDVVYFTKYAPEEIEVDSKKYLLVRVDSIIAKEEE